MNAQTTRSYKAHIMVRPALSHQSVNKLLTDATNLVTKHAGKVNSSKLADNVVKLKTAIDKKYTAWYICICMTAPTEHIKTIERELNLIQDFSRVLIIKSDDDVMATFIPVNEKDYKNRTKSYWLANVRVENPCLLELFIQSYGAILTKEGAAHLIGNKKVRQLRRQIAISIKQARYMGWLPLKIIYGPQDFIQAPVTQ